ncbi:hypothetical protein J1N35_019310 [Gossypium stocksii]|uniref:Uncharacterized protein n=1 Tax=Gossypium stocksii TaxID=47602 RepID=A0A9D3VSA9_9ROSI|nr:hypothetical protein J1N35_019310 [Gossypium stocksii]
MAQVLKVMYIAHSLSNGALKEVNKRYNNKTVDFKKAVKTRKDSLAELRQKYQESTNLIGWLDTQVITLKGGLFIPNTPDAKDNEEGLIFKDQNLEEPPPTEEASIAPTSQPNEGDD